MVLKMSGEGFAMCLSDRRVPRLALAVTLVGALALGACGRKGGLDAPPSSMPAAPQPQAMQPSLGESPPIFGGPAFGSGEPRPSPQQQAAQEPQPKKSFFLDWLIN
jgi:predicted small lipoprotein YifL